MNLFDPLFGSEAINAVFSDEARLQRMLDFEAGLARAEAGVGVIPAAAAEKIGAQCRVEFFNLPDLAKQAAMAGNLAIPLIKQLTALIAAQDSTASGYVHWGATSQDVIDTGLILQLRDGFDLLEKDLTALCDSLAQLADAHRATIMAGRTWMQQAVPIAFGLKAAGWLDAMGRHRPRIDQCKQRLLVLQLGGAAGTLAALRGKGLAVAEALADELKLTLSALPWHSHRDRIAEAATTLALLTGTLGKMARDISLLSQTEIGEVAEPDAPGRGGSSTMPQKLNPVGSAVVLSAALRVPGLTSTMLSAMVQENERGAGGWHAEWETLPEIFRLTGGALHTMAETISGLSVDAGRMSLNLEITHGLIFAESASMALASRIGKSAAHTLVEHASRLAIQDKKHLRDVLMADPDFSKHFTAQQTEALFDTRNYLGSADAFIQCVLDDHKKN